MSGSELSLLRSQAGRCSSGAPAGRRRWVSLFAVLALLWGIGSAAVHAHATGASAAPQIVHGSDASHTPQRGPVADECPVCHALAGIALILLVALLWAPRTHAGAGRTRDLLLRRLSLWSHPLGRAPPVLASV